MNPISKSQLILVSMFMLVLACERRQYDNPFDPEIKVDPPRLIGPHDSLYTSNLKPSLSWHAVNGAQHYVLDITNVISFKELLVHAEMLSDTIYSIKEALRDGKYWWRVKVKDKSDWSETRMFNIDSTVPRLLRPYKDLITNASPTDFVWTYRSSLTGAHQFHLQVDNNSDFGSPEIDQPFLETQEYSHLPVFMDGAYYWRVRVKDVTDIWGEWSDPWSFTINMQVPVLMDLVDGIIINEARPVFDWSDVSGTSVYQLQVDDNRDFASPEISDSLLNSSEFTPGSNLSDTTYYWRVRSQDVLENWGGWSEESTFRILTTRLYGGFEMDVGYSISLTTDGGFIIGGYTNSSPSGAGGSDIWLIRTDPLGVMIWNRIFGGFSDDRGYSVQQSPDGGFTIGGYTKSFGAGRTDMWLIRTDQLGNEIWNKTLGGADDDFGRSIDLTLDGGIIIVGYTESYGAGFNDIWLVKADAFGNEIWSKTFGTKGDDRGYSVKQTNDGGFIIAGWTELNGRGNNPDIWLIKTDHLGDEIWNHKLGGSRAYAVQQTLDGGFIVAGESSGNLSLIKTDHLGSVIWNKAFVGSNDAVGFSVEQTRDGGFIIGGRNSYDFWLIRTGQLGDKKWSKRYGASDSEIGLSVLQRLDGGFVLVGFTNSWGAGRSDILLMFASDN